MNAFGGNHGNSWTQGAAVLRGRRAAADVRQHDSGFDGRQYGPSGLQRTGHRAPRQGPRNRGLTRGRHRLFRGGLIRATHAVPLERRDRSGSSLCKRHVPLRFDARRRRPDLVRSPRGVRGRGRGRYAGEGIASPFGDAGRMQRAGARARRPGPRARGPGGISPDRRGFGPPDPAQPAGADPGRAGRVLHRRRAHHEVQRQSGRDHGHGTAGRGAGAGARHRHGRLLRPRPCRRPLPGATRLPTAGLRDGGRLPQGQEAFRDRLPQWRP